MSACFGGPLLNILLGVGLSGSYFVATNGHPYAIAFDATLMTTAVALVVLLGGFNLFSLCGWTDSFQSSYPHIHTLQWILYVQTLGHM